MSLSKYELKALEYRARAQDAAAAAQASRLERAREQHEIAAARWTELAEAEEGRAVRDRARVAATEPS